MRRTGINIKSVIKQAFNSVHINKQIAILKYLGLYYRTTEITNEPLTRYI